MKHNIFKYFCLLMLMVMSMGAKAQTASDTYLDISNYASIGTVGFSSNVDQLYDYNTSTNTLVLSVYGSYQSVSKQTWITTEGTGSASRTWDATGLFKGSSYYHTSTTAKCATVNGSRHCYFNIKGITSVSALVKSGGKSRSAILNVTEGETQVGTSSDNSNTVATISVTGLDATKTYQVELTGSDDSNNSDAYEIAFVGSSSSQPKTDVTLAFNNPTTTVVAGQKVTNVVTTTPAGVTGVTYASGDTNIATVNSSTGEVTGVTAGSTTITASFAGNDNYNPATSVSYNITVTASGETPV
ncbi:MAG: Ig-like domain-containing protein, partial [Prevotella sp.]|nr:Ig-like domain-containing protein [Prevotella sp.]